MWVSVSAADYSRLLSQCVLKVLAVILLQMQVDILTTAPCLSVCRCLSTASLFDPSLPRYWSDLGCTGLCCPLLVQDETKTLLLDTTQLGSTATTTVFITVVLVNTKNIMY